MGETRRIYLHIGAPKTGTTYLQSLLAHNRQVLADKGILYPSLKGDAHHKPVWDLRGTPEQRKDAKRVQGSWQRLVDTVNGSDLDALISSEHLVFARDPHVKQALAAFQGKVHVIFTARDLLRQVPAVWQERIKNQQTVTYRAFVESIMGAGGPGSRAFWTAQDPAGALQRWSVGDADRMHVVTAPPPGIAPHVLWDRFLSVLGLPGSDFDLQLEPKANASLSLTQAELLRRYNARHAADMPWVRYRTLLRAEVGGAFAAIEDSRRISLTAREQEFFASRAATINDELRAKGYAVHGSLTDLAPHGPATTGSDAVDRASGEQSDSELSDSELSAAELLDAALDLIHGLVSRHSDGA